MPDPRQRLEDGLRRERAGLIDAALERYRQAAEEADDPSLAAEALRHQADAYRARCDWDLAVEAAQRSAAVATDAGLVHMLAEALNAEALVHLSRGDFSRAESLLRRMLELSDEPRLRGIALQNLASISAQTGDLDGAQRAFQQSYECFRAARYGRGEALSLNNVGRVMLDRAEAELAVEILRRAVELARAVEDGDLLALAMTNLGEALMREGSLLEAEEMTSSALGFYAMAGNTWRRVETLKLLGDIHARHGDHETATACWRQGLALAREIGARVETDLLEQRLAEARDGGT